VGAPTNHPGAPTGPRIRAYGVLQGPHATRSGPRAEAQRSRLFVRDNSRALFTPQTNKQTNKAASLFVNLFGTFRRVVITTTASRTKFNLEEQDCPTVEGDL
jgi:hypothetical protein